MNVLRLFFRCFLTLPAALRGAREHRLAGEAARLAYFFFLSLFPLLLVVFSLSGYLGGADAFRWLVDALETVVPPESRDLVERFAARVATEPNSEVVSAGLVLAVWSASGVFAALSEALNRVFGGVKEQGWLRRRVRAVVLLALVCGGLATLASGLLLLPALLHAAGADVAWRLAATPLAFAVVAMTLGLLLYLLPDRDLSRRRPQVAAAALFGATLLFAAAWIFRHYLHRVTRFDEIYGVVAGAIVLLVWMYVAAFVILVAGEVAAELPGRGRSR